jgi:hypothetical protein
MRHTGAQTKYAYICIGLCILDDFMYEKVYFFSVKKDGVF